MRYRITIIAALVAAAFAFGILGVISALTLAWTLALAGFAYNIVKEATA